jgi:hypothetical protein
VPYCTGAVTISVLATTPVDAPAIARCVHTEMTREDKLTASLADVLAAIAAADAAGCLDHTDCWEEANAKWYAPLEKARALLKETR